MTTLHKPNPSRSKSGAARQRGTTIIELAIALTVFLLIGAAAFNLFNVQQAAAITQQGQVGLSLSLRNAASQLQLDLSNAGDGYLEGLNIPNWPPIGIVLVNNWVAPGTSCNTGTSYSSTCFDQINIVSAANSSVYPPIHATDSTGAAGTGNCSQTNNGVAYGQAAPVSSSFPSGLTLAQTAALFNAGDQVMFITNSGKLLTTAVLTGASATSTAVKFSFNATTATGSNTAANDPLGFTTTALPAAAAIQFSNQYCGTDWIIKLSSVQYSVATNPDPNNPWELVRKQNGGAQTVVMDQIIGFKVGAAIWNSYNSDFNNVNGTNYYYSASQYAITNTAGTTVAEPSNFNLVRAVRVSLIGRTNPNTDTVYTYRNTFDQGPYQVQGMAIVVNPRNLSMNDDSSVYMNKY